MTQPNCRPFVHPGVALLARGLLATLAVWLLFAQGVSANDLQGQLSSKRSQLQAERSRQARLSTTLNDYSAQIGQLSSQVAALRDRETRVRRQLAVKEAELRRAKTRLAKLRKRLHASMKTLRERLVATYESAPPNALDVILSARGFDQLSSRYEYLSAIEHQDASIVTTVRRLRNEARDTVNEIQAARDQLAAQRQVLARTRSTLQARVSGLAAARSRKANTLSEVRANSQSLQGDINDLQGRIAAAAQAAQEQQAESSALGGAPSVPTTSSLGPVPAGQAISPFPASAPIAWGRTDQGVDGTTTPGTPLLAMGTGTVTIGHDPAGFGTNYPILQTSFGSFYYGHCVPTVTDRAHVSIGQPIATAHTGTWGNSTTPGGFEIGAWPPGDMTAGGAIRSWLIGLPRR
jgi:peptidoglycan hydrolase CwlO-like protein